MAVSVVTVDIMVSYMHHPSTGIVLLSCQNSRLQPRRYGKGLEGGAWLIGLADAEIIPKLIVFFYLLLLRHGLYSFRPIIFRQVSWLVQIEVGIRRLCQNLPILGIHNENRRILAALSWPGLILVSLIKRKDMLLHNVLHLQINGRNHRIPCGGLLHRPLKGRILIQIPVFFSVRPVENGIVGRLNPTASHISIHRKADYVAG